MPAALLTLVVLLGLLASLRWTGWAGVAGLVVAALVWIPTNSPLEGLVLLRLSRDHGFTTADILTLVALAVAAARGRVLARRS